MKRVALSALLFASVLPFSFAKGFEVKHEPLQPKSGQIVRVTVEPDAPAPKEGLLLHYQIVDPGKYIARKDKEFEKDWHSIGLNDSGEEGDAKAGDGVWSAELPGETQAHRRLVRYRIFSASDNKRMAPDTNDAQSNFAYFCYDGVPAWKGAIDRNSQDPKLREIVTYGSEALQKVPVYHFLSRRTSIENVTWLDQKEWGPTGRNNYEYTGTMVYDGVVYDHVEFRARGGEWRYAMGKNMWKFNFLPGHRLEARDNFGSPYQAKWDKLNLGACIQQADTGLRGEQGMLEAVGFKLFNLAGLEAPRTHWVHLRIIDSPEESPANQFEGDFWGLYLATENIDSHFVKEHKLPKGNIYKMEPWGPKLQYNGNPAITNRSDVLAFMRSLRIQQPDTWWQQTVDLPRYYTYRSILECIRHYDIQSGKNYFYYFNLDSKKWAVLPWDIDLSWADHVYGTGHEPFYAAGLLRRDPFRSQYQERQAEIRDILFNEEQINLLIDEFAGIISGPNGEPSIAGADRARWDYNPIMSSRIVQPGKAGRGRFYFADPKNDFRIMVNYMKDYAARRMKWIDARLLAGYQPPAAPKIAGAGALKFKIEGSSAGGESGRIAWRLAEVTTAPKAGVPNPYEINAIWEKQLSASQIAEVPGDRVQNGRRYRVRARWQDSAGRWSRWSGPVEFTAGRN